MINKINANLPTPSLILDYKIFLKNINKMSTFSRNNNIKTRPHAKTHKTPEIAKIQIKNGSVGVCVANIYEAEVMAKNNIPGILLTSPIINEYDKNRLNNILKISKNFCIVIDSKQAIEYLSEICFKHNLKCRVLIDIDIMSDGKKKIGRTGARNPVEVLKLCQLVNASENLLYEGICAYAGDIQHINDYLSRLKQAKKRYDYLSHIIDNLIKNNLKPKIVSGGGTGSHIIDTKSGLFTEIQPGSYIFSDVEYDKVQLNISGSNNYKASLFIASTVISIINKNNFIVNSGLKAFSTDSSYLPKPIINELKFHFKGDEHGMITTSKKFKKTIKLGDTILIQPSHCDPTVNLYDKIRVYDKKIIKTWNISARGYF